MAGGQIQFGMSFKIDKTGLNELKTELMSIQKLTTAEYAKGKNGSVSQLAQELKQIKQSASEVQTALEKSFNINLGTLNVVKFNQELKKLDINRITRDLNSVGSAGKTAFKNVVTETLTTNLQLKETHKLLDDIATSMGNTIKWGVTSSVFNNMTGAIQKAWNFSKQLDTSLNSIRIVTGKSADEMENFAKQANKVSLELARSTRDYTEASLIYYQQGLGDEEVKARTETTLKAANATGQTGAEVSEQLTAVWNGYKVAAEETELYIDKLAAVAASTASDLEELSTGISKVASAANTAGVDIDELTAQVATIVSVTREAPETVGSALKTIYARLGDLQIDGVDEFGVSLGTVSGQLEQVGVQILDESGNMRDMGDIITDLAAKWDTWTEGQKQAVAVAAGGKMQYTRLMTLMENWSMYTDALETAQNAEGYLQEQQDIYMESTEAHLQQLSTAWERVWNAMSDSKSTNNLIDVLTGLTTGMANFVEAIGGGGDALLMFGSIGTQVFSKQIAKGVGTMINNFKVAQENMAQLDAELEIIKQFEGINIDDSATQVIIEMKKQVLELGDLVSNEQHSSADKIIENINALQNQANAWEENVKAAEEYMARIRELDSVSLKNEIIGEDGESSKANEKTYNTLHNESLKAFDSYQKSIEMGTRNIKQHQKELEKMKGILRDLKDNGDIFDTDEQRDETFEYLRDTTGVLKEELDYFVESKQHSQDHIKVISEAIKEFDKVDLFDDPDVEVEDFEQAFEKLLNVYKNVNQEMRAEAEKTANVIEKEAEGRAQSFSEKIKAVQQEYNNFIENIKTVQLVQQFVNLTSAIGQVASGIQTLANIPTILEDDDLSTGEKALQIIMAISSALPLLVNGTTLATKAINTMIAANTGMGASTLIATGGVSALAAAVWSLLWPILAVIAVVGLVTAGIYGLVKAYNADADAAKEAKQSVEELSDAYEDCKNKVNELKDAMSQYDEAVDSLEDLKEGTDEYQEALEKANEEARKLIEQYGLFNDYSYDEKGLIKIDENALNEALTEAENTASKVRDSLLLAQMGSSQADLKYQRTSFSRKVGMLNRDSENGLYLEGTTYRSKERTSESIELDDKSVSAIVDGLNQFRDTQGQAEYDLLFSNENREILKDTILSFEGITPAVEKNIDQVLKQTDALKSLTDSTNNAAEKMGYISGEIISGVVEDEYSKSFESFATKNGETNQTLATNLKNAMSTLVQQREENRESGLQKQIQEATKKAQEVKNTGDLKEYYPNIKNDVDLIRTYAAEVKGIDWDTINNHVTIDDKWGKSSMTTDEGEVLIENKNDEQMRRELAAKKAVDNLKTQYENENRDFNDNLAESLQNLAIKASEFGSQYGTDFSNSMLAAIANGSQEFDFSSLFDDIIDPDAVPKILDMSTEDLMSKMGLSAEDIEKQGFSSAEQWAAAFKAGFEGYEWDMDKAISAAMSKRDEEIDALGLSKSKTEEYKEEIQEYSEHLMRIAKDSEDFADSLDKDAESAVVAAQSIIEMNKGIDALADGFEDWADVLKKSSKESQEYAEALGGIQDALSQIYGVEADYISNDFVVNHLKEIEQAAEGSETAIETLRKELTEDILIKIAVYNELDASVQNQLLDQIHQLEAQIPDIKVGTEIDLDDETYNGFLQTMQDIINTAGLTAEQANALFSTMGFDTNFATEEKEVEQTSPNTVTETTVKGYTRGTTTGPDGEEREWEYPVLSTSTYQDGTSTHTGKMTVMAMATSADGTKVPQIKSITKKGTGAQNNYSSKNKGGKSPGSKSSGSSKDPDKQDHIKDEKDPYHDIDIKIQQISTDLDKLQKQQSKFFGQKLIDNLSKQYELLGRQIEASTEKIKIAEGEAAKLRAELTNKGVKFNDDGTISNYAQAYNAQLNYVNSIIDKYNSMSAEEQEKYKDTVEQAKEDFEEFKTNIQEYDNTIIDIIPDLEASIQDAIDEQIELQIQKFNMEIEIRLDMAEAEREWNEFKKKVIDGIKDEDILGSAKARLQDFYSYYKADNTGSIQAGTKQINNLLEQLRQINETGISSVYGDNKTQALEDLQTYYSQLMSDLTDIVDLQEDIHQSYLDMIDEAQDKFDKQIDAYEQISKLIEHDMKLIELIGGEDSYEDLIALYDKQYANNLAQLDFQRQQVDFWKEQMDLAEENSDEWEAAKENWIAATDEWRSAVEDSIQTVQDKYLNAINLIFQKLNNKVTSGAGLDYISEEWELINANADQYLDTINSMYGIQALESKYLDAINQTDSVAAQKKLNDLMQQELSALEEKDKLTQYDIDRANMKYEIALKQIALEEAQQNKSSMRLRRDSQGNYSYQFVSDQDAINQAQDELSALQNDLYNFDLDKYRNNLDEIYKIWEEYQQKMVEAAQINDPEERAARELLLNEQYGELINGLVDQNATIRLNLYESAFTELADLYNVDLANFQQLSVDEQDILMNDMIPQWSSGIQEMADVFAGEGGFVDVCEEAMNQLADATEEYENNLQEVENTANIVYDDIAEGIDKTISQTQDLLSNNGDLINSYRDELDVIRSIVQEMDNLISKYKSAEAAAKAATEAAYKYAQEENKKAAEAAAKENAKMTGSTSNSTNNNSNNNSASTASLSSGSGAAGSGSGDGNLQVGDTATYTGKYYYDSYGTSPAGSRYSGVKDGVKVDMLNNNPYGAHIRSADGKISDLGWVKKSQLSGFDTGGYTGDWGDNSGKLAMLHKKELVLNAQDTENMLSALKVLESIVGSIGNNMLYKLAALGDGIGAPQATAALSDTLEQNVHIDASFPNVQNSKEIEDAFNNLVNIASQRIHKSKR